METRGEGSFLGMTREFPVRTALFTFAPPAIGALQLVNGYVNGLSLAAAGVFSGVLVAYAVVVTRYHLAAYRLSGLLDSAD